MKTMMNVHGVYASMVLLWRMFAYNINNLCAYQTNILLPICLDVYVISEWSQVCQLLDISLLPK